MRGLSPRTWEAGNRVTWPRSVSESHASLPLRAASLAASWAGASWACPLVEIRPAIGEAPRETPKAATPIDVVVSILFQINNTRTGATRRAVLKGYSKGTQRVPTRHQPGGVAHHGALPQRPQSHHADDPTPVCALLARRTIGHSARIIYTLHTHTLDERATCEATSSSSTATRAPALPLKLASVITACVAIRDGPGRGQNASSDADATLCHPPPPARPA